MDVADWLRQLGLGRYEALFRENEVGADLLPSLTGEDLRDLGVTAVGHRRRLMDAILALRTGSQPVTPPPPTTIRTDRDDQELPRAERRHITVLFCDIVGSTPLSGRLDPEDLRKVIDAYQRSVAAVVTGLRGTIARFVGDGILVYFGWPTVDEAHAESAARAGLAIVTAIHPQRLAVRIGIATGLVVADDLVGAGVPQILVAVGETPNLAARLQSVAEPDAVVVSDATRAQLGRLFDLKDLGSIELKGFGAPQRAWQVLRETALASRSEALYGGALTPLIGRDNELDLLLRHWRQAKTGQGQAVLLSGEPGIGKSRLIAELEERLLKEQHISFRYFCSPHRGDTVLHPVIAHWERVLGDAPAERLANLEAVLTPLATPPEDIRLIADLLSVPADAHHPALELSPIRRKERTFAALHRFIATRATLQPVLMLFEDAHWADPTSLELMDTIIPRLSDLPILLVVSFRPEFTASWVGQAGVTLITLSRLTRRQATELATQVTNEQVLPPLLLERVVAQSDGVPLFIEELTKAVVETTDACDSIPSSLAVPATLQASLMARLDRLPAAKQVAQIAAVIGREFSDKLLSAVAWLPEVQLGQGLEELVEAGLASRRGVPPCANYAFKHALVRDAAYESLLRVRRAELHAAIVDAMERDADIATRQPEVLGYHCAQAGLDQKAAIYYLKAAGSPQRYAQVQVLLERALEFDPSSVSAMTMLASVMMARPHNFGQPIDADEVKKAEQLILRASEIHGDNENVLMARAYWLRDQLRFAEARDLYEQLVSMNPDNAAAQTMLGICLVEQGSVEAAIPHYKAALQLDPSDHIWLKQWRIGEALLFLGHSSEAIPWFRQALAANPDNTANNRSYINLALAGAYARFGQLDLARHHVSEANSIWPFHTVRNWRRHLPFAGLAPKVELVREELRRAGLRDHANEYADFGVPANRNLENDGFGRTPTTAPGVTTISTNALIALLAQSKPLVIDPMFHSWRSIPGAVGLKFAGAGGSVVDRLQDRLRRKLMLLLDGNAKFPIVTLGWNSEAWSGRNLALRLAALGYTNVNWYRGGLEAWEVHGLPETELAMQDW
jgi:class 3 adenylate cyclase/tetratricopeptide (TPR) repeat protein